MFIIGYGTKWDVIYKHGIDIMYDLYVAKCANFQTLGRPRSIKRQTEIAIGGNFLHSYLKLN